MIWESFRAEILGKYEKALIDEWIKPITDSVNLSPNFVTLSSCAGRIAVMDMEGFGDKKNAVFLGKWHEIPEFEEVLEALRKGKKETWFMIHPPILHIACRDLANAQNLLDILKECGFRRAGIISTKKWVVEVYGQERIEFLAGRNGRIVVDEKALKINFELGVEKLKKSRERFRKFHEKFIEAFL